MTDIIQGSNPTSAQKEAETLRQKNIDFAAEAVSESVFYHYTDSTHKEKLKTALKMFANILLSNQSILSEIEKM